MADERKKSVAIVGGGITGLTIAYYLQKEIMSKRLNLEYKLFESSDKLGGKIQTDYTNGFVIEQGPDSFLARKQSAAKLAREVGLENELVHNDTGQSFVLKGDQLYPIPGGAIMGIPTKLAPFATTKLFSPMAKLRAAGDLFLPKTSQPDEDQSLGHFFRRRLGDEVVENLIEPLLSGIYAGDIDQLSLMATFPQFHQVEQKHRSLILGMSKVMPKPAKAVQPNKSRGMFMSFNGGLQSFVDSIENHLDEDAVKKSVRVHSIMKEGEQYKLTFTDGQVEIFDRIILTTPHEVTSDILRNYSHIIQPLKEIPSTSVATVAMAFPLSSIKGNLGGTGFVVAKNSGYSITACTWTHKKWKHSAPEDYALLRCYVGRFGNDEIVSQSDDEILAAVKNDLNKIMKIDEPPQFHSITRWKKAMPQYIVGHKQRIEMLKTSLKKDMPGVYVAGAAYEGLGLPDCIDQGEAVVQNVVQSFEE
ncbi:MAG: protoporphyrinogen oxidase [Bacillaceae bacterium]|mgnify:CR=1 FL=1|nr:protoporphyrinogen oxidase [Bacillaceae bacterium]